MPFLRDRHDHLSSRHCYLLESASQTESWGRYSFLGCHPTLELNLTDGELTIRRTAEARIGAKTQEAEAGKTDATDASETVEVRKVTHPGEALREILKDYKSPVLEGLSPIYRRPGRLLLQRRYRDRGRVPGDFGEAGGWSFKHLPVGGHPPQGTDKGRGPGAGGRTFEGRKGAGRAQYAGGSGTK